MKDLFSGSLGKLNNHGGSRMFTTPNTVYVPPEYEVETDVPSVAEFVTCTLDGRLWVFRRSRRYYVAVFRWDEETEKLVFVSTTILNGETIIKRGVDWILTDKSLILSSDDEPYISRTEYEDSDTNYIDRINRHFSFFSELNMWIIFQKQYYYSLNTNGLPSGRWKTISQSSITPLEFYYDSSNNLQTITNTYPKLLYFKGQLYGKGKANIGRVYLLPKTINQDGEPNNFYLYTLPDYLRTYDAENQKFNDNDGWDKLLLAPLNNDSVCIFTPENESYELCKKAKNGQVLSLPQNEQLDFSNNNGAIFFDGFTQSNILLNDKEVSFLCDNLHYECKGLNQWIAPAKSIEAASSQVIISSFNNASITCFPQQGFYRVLCQSMNIFPLWEQKLALAWHNHNNKKYIDVYKADIHKANEQTTAIWDKIYRQFINIEPVNSFIKEVQGNLSDYCYISESVSEYDYLNIIVTRTYDTDVHYEHAMWGTSYPPVSVITRPCIKSEANLISEPMPDSGIWVSEVFKYHTNSGTIFAPDRFEPIVCVYSKISGFTVNPEDGSYSDFDFEKRMAPKYTVIKNKRYVYTTGGNGYDYDDYDINTYTSFSWNSTDDNKLSWFISTNDFYNNVYDISVREETFFDIPQATSATWISFNEYTTDVQYGFYLDKIRNNICTFIEKSTRLQFIVDMNTLFPDANIDTSGYDNFYSKNDIYQDTYGNKFAMKFRYVIRSYIRRGTYIFYTIKIEISPELINILSNLQRSNVS